MKKHNDYINKVKKTDLSKFSNKKKVELGLLDNFAYSNIEDLNDEIGRLSYSVEEWFEEEFDKAIEASRNLTDVYYNNSEGFIDSADVAGDAEILQAIESTADELGLTPQELYEDFDEHKEALRYLDYLEKKFAEQEREVRTWFP